MTVYGGAASGPGGGQAMRCPDCGRPVNQPGAKLCPHCGYPLMFETSQQQAQVQPEYLRKPVAEVREADPDSRAVSQGAAAPYVPYVSQDALGPYCPSCGHRNPVRRVRCERCGTELWPGSAAPVRRAPGPPPTVASQPRKRRPWGTIAALIAVPVVAALVMYLLALALG